MTVAFSAASHLHEPRGGVMEKNDCFSVSIPLKAIL